MKLLLTLLSFFLWLAIPAYSGDLPRYDEGKYKKYKDQGDKLFEKGAMLDARKAYQVALKNKPADKYVAKRIEECDKKIEHSFNEFKHQADKMLGEGNTNGAAALYDSARIYNPEDTYIKAQQEKCFSNTGNTFYKTLGGKNYDGANSIAVLNDGSMVIAGRSDSNSKNGDMNMQLIRIDNTGNVMWEKNFGETETEEPWAVIGCKDGGVLAVGYSDSYGSGSGLKDVWVVKTDKNGNKEWDKVFITNEDIDEATAVTETDDGGYILTGTTTPLKPGNVSDIIAIKITATGNEVWKKVFRETANEEGSGIVKTKSGYAIVGRIDLGKGKKWDLYVLAIDKEGNKLWSKNYGGNDDDMGNTITVTQDGGLLLAGYTYSFATEGSHDAWVVKTDSQGNEQWSKSFGGGSTDEAFSVLQTKDKSFIVAGYTDVFVGDRNGVNTSKEVNNILLVRLSEKGDVLWERSIGGENNQRCYGIVEDREGNYVLTGFTDEDPAKNADIMVVKVNRGGIVSK